MPIQDAVSSSFERLVGEVKACVKCARMKNSERVLGHASGSLTAGVMFIGEAPGRRGADMSQIPFHGDQSGHNFEALLDAAGLSRYESFVTNAVLCNPKDENGNNSTPTGEEIKNCSAFLRRQIDLIQPAVVVTLGSVALKAVSNVLPHELAIGNSVGKAIPWYGRKLIPVYHPGQRAMIHRSFADQLLDYRFVSETLRKSGRAPKRLAGKVGIQKTVAVINQITRSKPRIGYFALHKIFFLLEIAAIKKFGHRITNSFILRQQDGPYCVDLHVGKLKKLFPNLVTTSSRAKLFVERSQDGLFAEPELDCGLATAELEIITEVLKKYGAFSDAELKRRAYLTTEMRRVLRLERSLKSKLLNMPLLQPTSVVVNKEHSFAAAAGA